LPEANGTGAPGSVVSGPRNPVLSGWGCAGRPFGPAQYGPDACRWSGATHRGAATDPVLRRFVTTGNAFAAVNKNYLI